MSVEAPTNCWTESQDKIMTALANSARFREIIVVSDVPAALLKVFGEQLRKPDSREVYEKEELKNLKGYGQVYSADETPYGFADDGSSHRKFFGNSIIVFRRLVTDYEANSQTVPLELERLFQNRVGDAMNQVHDYLNDKSGPFIKGMVVPDAPWLNDPKQWDQVGMWQMTEVAVAWGHQV